MAKKDPLAGLLSWHWSPDHPCTYAIHREDGEYGIGHLATVHPGAFNLVWALLGSPTSKRYLEDLENNRMPEVGLSWVVAAAQQGMCIHTLIDPSKSVSDANINHWPVIDRASQVGLGEYYLELTTERNMAVLNMTGCDLESYIKEAYRKKVS